MIGSQLKTNKYCNNNFSPCPQFNSFKSNIPTQTCTSVILHRKRFRSLDSLLYWMHVCSSYFPSLSLDSIALRKERVWPSRRKQNPILCFHYTEGLVFILTASTYCPVFETKWQFSKMKPNKAERWQITLTGSSEKACQEVCIVWPLALDQPELYLDKVKIFSEFLHDWNKSESYK